MPLRFFNTLSRSLEEFTPIRGAHAGIYACGPTVYRPPHIGNFRTFVFNDVLRRYLQWKGFDVRFVMNLTDVEDKIIAGAAERGVAIGDVTAPVIEAFFADLDTLGIRPADAWPHATAHIPEMIDIIERLIERGHAYVRDGSVYFDISSFPAYGRLARLEAVEMRAGAGLATRSAGIDSDEYEKEDARDFALWKAAKEADRATGACWDTPWGPGRPGWHIECSAMSMKELGETFDIHTGGEDLVFPHHEDEIAQSEGATGKPFARVWLHVTHLKVNGEKMSKSLRNDFTIGQLVERGFRPAEIRFIYLQAHYRKELNFSFDGLEDARVALGRLTGFRRRLEETPVADDAPDAGLEALAARALTAFGEALDDDLNTQNALAVLFPWIREVNNILDGADRVSTGDLDATRRAFDRMDDVLGIVRLALRDTAAVEPDLAAWVEARIEQRRLARARRDFAAADAIRDELLEAGITVEDTAGGTRWHRG